VTFAYYQYLYLHQKQNVLLYADTIISNFLAKANLRFQKGETNVLEKLTAENQKSGIELELLQVQNSLKLVQLQFQLLLNSNTEVHPDTLANPLLSTVLFDSASPAASPQLAVLQKQIEVAAAQTSLQRASMQPEVFAGYFNNSFKGTGADNKLYGGSHRFHSAQVGMALPIFSKSQKNKVKAYQVAEDIAESEYQQQALALQVKRNELLTSYKNNLAVINHYRNVGFANANQVVETANRQFLSGEINYLDWVTIVRQAITIRLNHIEAIKAYNDTIIELQYLETR
jgi:cobalt-zinc-cadmium resistance protein CzcA